MPIAGCKRHRFSKAAERLTGGLVWPSFSSPSHTPILLQPQLLGMVLPPAGRGRSSHHHQNLVQSLSLCALALRAKFRAVDKIVIVTDIVNHTKELLIGKDLYLKALISGYRRTRLTAYGLYDFTMGMKYFACLENYYSRHLEK